jgi:hypothetical protein
MRRLGSAANSLFAAVFVYLTAADRALSGTSNRPIVYGF